MNNQEVNLTDNKTTERKRKSIRKRSDSGLVRKDIYLHDDELKRLECLAISMNYNLSDRGLSSEQLSMLVSYLIDIHDNSHNFDSIQSYGSHYLRRLHKIIVYRAINKRETPIQIAGFLKRNKFKIPREFNKLNPTNHKYSWSEFQVSQLLNYNHSMVPLRDVLDSSEARVEVTPKPDKTYDEVLDELDLPFEEDEHDVNRSKSTLDLLFNNNVIKPDTEKLRIKNQFDMLLYEEYGRTFNEQEFFHKFNQEKEAAITSFAKLNSYDEDDDIYFE